MRWRKRKDTRPGSRTVRKFIWWPTKLAIKFGADTKEWRWLEMATIEQTLLFEHGPYYNLHWVD